VSAAPFSSAHCRCVDETDVRATGLGIQQLGQRNGLDRTGLLAGARMDHNWGSGRGGFPRSTCLECHHATGSALEQELGGSVAKVARQLGVRR
jgi:hypothetical protein